MRLLLLHPPLLSPVVWSRMVPLLHDAGHDVAVPDLRDPVASGWWEGARDAAVAACPDAEVVVAHSGAGVLVPVVCKDVATVKAVVLLDAVLPPPYGEHRTPTELRDAVAGMATGGVLPPWTSWWGEDKLAALVPDEAARRALVAEAPSLPAQFFDIAVPAPAGWEPARRTYVQLSPSYDAEVRDAASRGWRTVSLPGRHLDLLSRPDRVGRAVLEAV